MLTLLNLGPRELDISFFEGIINNVIILIGAFTVAAAIIVAAILISRAIKKSGTK